MTIPALTTANDHSCPPRNADSLLTEALDLLMRIGSTLRIADADTQIAVARLLGYYLGDDDGDHFPKVLDTITELRDRIYDHIDQPGRLMPAPSSHGG